METTAAVKREFWQEENGGFNPKQAVFGARFVDMRAGGFACPVKVKLPDKDPAHQQRGWMVLVMIKFTVQSPAWIPEDKSFPFCMRCCEGLQILMFL